MDTMFKRRDERLESWLLLSSLPNIGDAYIKCFRRESLGILEMVLILFEHARSDRLQLLQPLQLVDVKVDRGLVYGVNIFYSGYRGTAIIVDTLILI